MAADTYLTALTRCAWRGPSLLVLDSDGWVGQHPLSGFYFREARFLSQLRLQAFGEKIYLCSLSDVAPQLIESSFMYPPVAERGGGGSGSGGTGKRHGILFRSIDFDLRTRVRPASLEIHSGICCRFDEEAELELAWQVGADFADIEEAEADRRQQQAPIDAEPIDGGVRFVYRHDDLPLAARMTIEGPGGWRYADGALHGRLALRRQQRVELILRVVPEDPEEPIDRAGEEEREAYLAEWHSRVARLSGRGDTPIADITNRAMAEVGSLALLEGDRSEWLAPAAGVPLYPALFGRDSFTLAWQAAVLDRGEMLDGTYNRLARFQGTEHDDWRDEAPGRALQQHRRGPLPRLEMNPFRRYYGDYASPMMFIISLAQMYAFAGEKQLIERHWDNALAVLDWARTEGDLDGDGYLEYLTRSPMGPKNQGWKDSDNAVVYADGSQVEPPIATCEVQAYWFAALVIMAVLSAVRGELGRAHELWGEAQELKERFNRDFWMEDEGYVCFGLDADKRQIGSIVSNPGQCVVSGIIARERVPRVVKRLFAPDLFSGWGIRTLSTRNPSYHPLSYHLGTVWPSENASMLFGLRRYGFDDLAVQLAGALYDLSRLWRDHRTPECVGGYAREERIHPGAYPHANSPQGWNQSVFPIMIQSLLGLRPVASLRMLAVDPILPPWIPELTVEGLRIGDARATIRFWRDDGKSHFEVVERHGALAVVRQPPLDSFHAGLWDRLGALAETVFPWA